MIVPGLGEVPVFPCNAAKVPMVKAWAKAAKRVEPEDWWPLTGVPTGATSGIDALDVDPEGLSWFREFPVPVSRTHVSPRGYHVLFRHAVGLRNSSKRIADGVDIRADGGYVCWYPWNGGDVLYADHGLAEWPQWLLRMALEVGHRREPTRQREERAGGIVAVGLLEAFRKLDVLEFRGRNDRWFELMVAAKSAGIGKDDWLDWCLGDPHYAGDAEEIEARWDSVGERHAGALWRELSAAGVKVRSTPITRAALFGEHPPEAKPTRNFHARLDQLQRTVERSKTEPTLFWAACRMAEIVAERRVKMSVAVALLKSAAHGMDRDVVHRTIANGFATVERKIVNGKS